jgi:hypothetical protein
VIGKRRSRACTGRGTNALRVKKLDQFLAERNKEGKTTGYKDAQEVFVESVDVGERGYRCVEPQMCSPLCSRRHVKLRCVSRDYKDNAYRVHDLQADRHIEMSFRKERGVRYKGISLAHVWVRP